MAVRKVQPFGSGVVKGVGGHFPVAIDPVVFPGGGHGAQVIIGGIVGCGRGYAARGLARELNGERGAAGVRRCGRETHHQRRQHHHAHLAHSRSALIVGHRQENQVGAYRQVNHRVNAGRQRRPIL